MADISWLGVVWFMMASGGSFPPDLVSLIQAEAYFQSRQVEVTAAQMAALAGKQPTDGKSQIGQLLAIRWLGNHVDAVKKEPSIRALLEAIAQGKRAQDRQGFARDYARRALARLDGKPAPSAPVPDNSLRTTGIEWFPRNAGFVGGIDYRGAPAGQGQDLKTVTDLLYQMLPLDAREEMYRFADAVGNLELQRVTFAATPDAKDAGNAHIYIRFTGRGDRDRLVAFIAKNLPGAKVKEEKDPKGEPLTLITTGRKFGAGMAFLGDTDLVMASAMGSQDAAKQREVLQEVLDVRAGRRAGLAKSPWGAELKAIPAKANLFFLSELPEARAKELTRGTPFQFAPLRVAIDMTRGKDLEMRFRGTFRSPADARSFCDSAAEVKQMGLMTLKNLPPGVKIKPKGVEALTKTLESVQFEPKESTVVGGVRVPAERVQTLVEVAEDLAKTFAAGKGF